jgi:hypothetical protein
MFNDGGVNSLEISSGEFLQPALASDNGNQHPDVIRDECTIYIDIQTLLKHHIISKSHSRLRIVNRRISFRSNTNSQFMLLNYFYLRCRGLNLVLWFSDSASIFKHPLRDISLSWLRIEILRTLVLELLSARSSLSIRIGIFNLY